MLFGNRTSKQLDTVRIETTYSSHHQLVEEAIGKHWHLLTGDPILRKYIKEYPQLTYRKGRSLKDRLVQSHFQEASPMIKARKGMYKCGICEYCNWILEGPSFVLPNGCTHKIGHYVDCQTHLHCVLQVQGILCWQHN